MAAPSRYNADDNTENGILRNKLNISNQKDLDDAETTLYTDAYSYFLDAEKHHKLAFSTKLLFEIHRYFLFTLYDWAGKARTIDISKGNTMFCSVRFIGNAMKELDKIIAKNLPTPTDTKESLCSKLAAIHCEFNAIHPFREGNGRTIRLFLDLLNIHAGHPLIDYSKSTKTSYINACIAGMKQDYKKMERVMDKGIFK
jgi:cell filamentation protein